MRLSDKVSIITGGGSGMGRTAALMFAAEGARVVVADFSEPGGEETVRLVREAGGEATFVRTDISSEADAKAMVDHAVATYGRVDTLYNNAGIMPEEDHSVVDTPVEAWDRVMAVNVRGPFLMVKHVAPGMIARRSGKIINVSSGTAFKGLPNMLHYVTSKAALLGFTRALSRDLGRYDICVNTLAPGLILSDSIAQNPEHLAMAEERVLRSRALERHGHPADLLGALIFLASAESDFVTGQTLAVDGGSINT